MRTSPLSVTWALALAGLVCLAAPGRATAQSASKPAPAAKDSTTAGKNKVKLVYDREVYNYPAANRRDPFQPLVGPNGDRLGPRFADLSLRGIIFSPVASKSVALLADAAGKIYRVKQGDLVGNARVVTIQPLKVNFEVDMFGTRRPETLELKHVDIMGGRQ